MKNIFDREIADEYIERINKLSTSSQCQWGKMDVSQMLAHCNVSYEYIYDTAHKHQKG
tara:strand:+ start:98755 stop:98928 length:174 start_codon:yes stop_codon:yes gene_type:complete